jgi:hypothetical protein
MSTDTRTQMRVNASCVRLHQYSVNHGMKNPTPKSPPHCMERGLSEPSCTPLHCVAEGSGVRIGKTVIH